MDRLAVGGCDRVTTPQCKEECDIAHGPTTKVGEDSTMQWTVWHRVPFRYEQPLTHDPIPPNRLVALLLPVGWLLLVDDELCVVTTG
jgi:hypothetical protein